MKPKGFSHDLSGQARLVIPMLLTEGKVAGCSGISVELRMVVVNVGTFYSNIFSLGVGVLQMLLAMSK